MPLPAFVEIFLGLKKEVLPEQSFQDFPGKRSDAHVHTNW